MNDSTQRTVVLGITGCIAAYKACEVARALVRDGIRVKVVMTEAATHFITPLTLRTLTGEPVVTSLWDPAEAPVHHISLAEETDLFAIVPCTANVMAKIATGRADDMLTTTALATEAPILIAPAMNTHMWRADATQSNVNALLERGSVIVGPGVGDLACGDSGEGRLADPNEIVEAIRGELVRTRDLEGLRIVVTAGPTYEPIDPVRFIGNSSSGKTGYWIAEEAAHRGAEVTLVSGPTQLPDPFGVRTVRVQTALEMQDVVEDAANSCDVVIATAAVSDYRPAQAAKQKVKKEEGPSAIELERNPDILAGLGEKKGKRMLVGFAAETEDVVANAKEKLAAKNLDMVVANDVSLPEGGFESDGNAVWIVTSDGVEEIAQQHKRAIARILLDRMASYLGRQNAKSPLAPAFPPD